MTVTGLDTTQFNNVLANCHKLHYILSRNVPDNSIKPLDINSFLQYSALETGTRYFTHQKEDPSSESLPFDRAVDPHGVLSGMVTDEHFHSLDNKVLYYRMTDNNRYVLNNRKLWLAN